MALWFLSNPGAACLPVSSPSHSSLSSPPSPPSLPPFLPPHSHSILSPLIRLPPPRLIPPLSSSLRRLGSEGVGVSPSLSRSLAHQIDTLSELAERMQRQLQDQRNYQNEVLSRVAQVVDDTVTARLKDIENSLCARLGLTPDGLDGGERDMEIHENPLQHPMGGDGGGLRRVPPPPPGH